MTFKAGDHVRIVRDTQSDCLQHIGLTGVLAGSYPDFLIVFDEFPKSAPSWQVQDHDSAEYAGKRGWYVSVDDLEKVRDESISLGVSQSIADDLKLFPQTRKVLAHLEAGKSISPLEAQNVYGIYRLAGRIHELRRAGYQVRMERREDEMGHRYGRYFLAS